MYYNTPMADFEAEEKLRQIREQHKREVFPLPVTNKTNWVVLALAQIRLFLF